MESFIQEQKKKRLAHYMDSLTLLLSFVLEHQVIELSEIKVQLDEQKRQVLIPSVEILKK